jgi:hypothetical protein
LYTLGAAAKATGKSKATISRAISSGRLSASRSDDGSYSIDPAELHRVFQPRNPGTPEMERFATVADPSAAIVALRQRVEEQAEVIRGLQGLLSAATDEKRRLLALLTDQRPKRRWFRWSRS